VKARKRGQERERARESESKKEREGEKETKCVRESLTGENSQKSSLWSNSTVNLVASQILQ